MRWALPKVEYRVGHHQSPLQGIDPSLTPGEGPPPADLKWQPPLLLPHPACQYDQIGNHRGETLSQVFQMGSPLSQNKRTATVFEAEQGVRRNDLIPRLIMNQTFIHVMDSSGFLVGPGHPGRTNPVLRTWTLRVM
jgi:hypothetical protein